MKKVFLLIFLTLYSIASFCQTPYYDALAIKSFGTISEDGKFEIESTNQNVVELGRIFNRYSSSIGDSEIEKEIDAKLVQFFRDNPNPFIEYSSSVQEASLATTAKSLASSTIGSVGGLNFTNLADGLAKFLVERTKEELNIAFFEKFRKELGEQDELRAIFPKTYSLLLAIGEDVYNFSSYINMLRETFQEDLKNIIPNLRTLLKSEGLRDYFKINPTIKVILNNALLIAEELQNGKHPGDVITSLKDENLNDKTIRNFTPSLQLLDLFSQSLKSEQQDRYWVSSDSLKLLIENKAALRIYLGLLYQQSAEINFESKDGKTEEGFRKILTNINTAYAANEEPIKTYLKTLIANAEQVDRNLKAIIELNTSDDTSSGYSEHYEFYNASIDLIEHSLKIQSIPAVKSLAYFDVAGFTKYFDIAQTAGDLYLDVREKNYFSAIINLNVILEKSIPSYEGELVETIKQTKELSDRIASVTDVQSAKDASDEIFAFLKLQGAHRGKEAKFIALENSVNTLVAAYDDPNREAVKESLTAISTFFTGKKDDIPDGLTKKYKEILPKLLKYGNLAASIAKAENSDEVQKIIESIALPAGSSSIKRRTKNNVSLNAYVGLSPGVSYNTVTENLGFNFGVTAPIGVAFSKGRDETDETTGKLTKKSSISFFISLIDLGAVTTYRFGDPDTEEIPEITLANIFSPGFFGVVGAKDSPFSFGLGAQIGPQLQKIDNIATTSEGTNLAFKFFFAVDIPLLNFKTVAR
ncbi:MAG: hypothetical protein ABJF04_11280 [Reichenbachiella sp.]|uniref:hypothetical protein n=1 Tax=Reichenbachiella sp. TaxID=2184521 RepID=UPI003266E3CA